MVAILRDPIERAYSSFLRRVAAGDERITDFWEAITQEREEDKAVAMNPSLMEPESSKPRRHYLKMGFYYKELKIYYENFKAEQIKICLYDDLKSDPIIMLREISK